LLIQGSAADQAKAAKVQFAERAPVEAPGARVLLSMHDEIVLSAPAAVAEQAAALLTDCMCNALPLDVPMVAEAKIGACYHDVK
jgi:DNA polymerase-1